MSAVEFGWMVPPGAKLWADTARDTFPADVRRALELVNGSLDSAWLCDHLQVGSHDIMECWTALGYFAALAPTLRFGTLVMSQSFRNPALVAKMAATIHYLTGGRLLLGLGAGWKEDEYHAYGYDYPAGGVRVAQLDEALKVIQALWRDERATFAGRYYRIQDARCEPKPEPRPPILIGGQQPGMLRLAARHADWWNVNWLGIDAYRALARRMDDTCTALGRDPATLRKTWYGLCSCAPTEEAARRAVEGAPVSATQVASGFIGTPAQIVDQLQEFIAVGVDYFIFNTPRFPDLTTLELLITDVLPALRGGADP